MSVPSPSIVPNPWLRILDALEKKINRHSYDTWLKPTRYSHASGGILFVRVPTAEFRHVGDKYADLIQEAIDNLGLEYEDVKFVTPEDDPASTPVRHDGGLSMAMSAAGGRHPVSSLEGAHPGGVLPYLQCAARVHEADRDRQRSSAEGVGRDRGSPAQPL